MNQIEFYQVHDDYFPNITQSVPQRDWMTASSTKHPYRCIPLTRANAHGWEIRLEHDVVVMWDGGENPDSVAILEGENLENAPHPIVSNTLGHGTLTFLPHLLVRTPEPYNLYVTGAPNHLVKGAVPLTGVVETWWSPYTFTMNWKIRYRNRPVRFPAGTPFVHFFPINSIELEQWTPVIKPIVEHPNADIYEEWSLDRVTNPSKKHDYYKKGIAPDGCPIAHKDLHKLKLSLREPTSGGTNE